MFLSLNKGHQDKTFCFGHRHTEVPEIPFFPIDDADSVSEGEVRFSWTGGRSKIIFVKR